MELDTSISIDPHDGEVVVPAATDKPADKPDFKATDDGNVVEYGGKKYYREEALQSERNRAQGYAKTIQQLEPLMPEFEQFLETRKNGRAATVDRATRNVESEDYNEDELTGYAVTRGYYDQDNKPDLKRAKDDLDIMTAIADRRAGRAVKPLATATAKEQAVTNLQRAMEQTFVDGEPVADKKYLEAAFNSVPDEIKSDPQVGSILTVVAAGLQALDERRSGGRRASRRGEPVFREGSGGRFDGAGEELDALDRAAARARGKTPEQWSKMTRTLTGGRGAAGGTVLEEI